MTLVGRSALTRLACALAALASTAADAAQALPPVEGTVSSAVSGVAIAGARVSAGERSALSDALGRFSLALPPGTWSLEATAAGFSPAKASVTVRADVAARVDFLLVLLAPFREQVDVLGGAAAAAPPAAIPVQPREVVGVAGGAENVFRVLQTLPGVAATDDFSSRLSVRGGGPDQNLTVMDGIEIHNPYRLFGLVSAFNPETVERFELTAGAFGARYGDRLSSLLVVDTRAGSSERALQGSAALSLTDTNLILEGKLPKGRGSWLATARRTYYDLVAERFTDDDLPSFADLQQKTVWNLGGGRTLSLFSLRSRERTDAVFDDAQQEAEGAVQTRTRNDLFAGTLHVPFARRAWSRTVGAFYTNTESVDFGGSFRDDERRSNAPGKDAFRKAQVAVTSDTVVRDRSLRQELGWQPADAHVLVAGFELHRLRTEIGFTIRGARNTTEANGSSVQGGVSLPDAIDSGRADTRLGAFVQDQWHPARRLRVDAGLRWDRSTSNEKSYVSPRLSLAWSLTGATRLRAALGVHTQSPGYEKLAQSDYFADLSGSVALHSERARHALVSLERELPGGALARVEGYYKGFERLIVGRLETPAEARARLQGYDFPDALQSSVPGEPRITTIATNDGRGRAYGFDMYLARRAASRQARLTGWASYTFGFAERNLYGRTYAFDYDRRHALSLVTSLRLSSRFELSATGRVASGFPYTKVLGLRVASTPDLRDDDGDGDREELVPDRDPQGLLIYTPDRGGVANLNSARLPYYARLDLRTTFTPRWGKGRVRLYLDFINALMRDNAGVFRTRLEHDPGADRPRIVSEPSGSIPFLPSFGVHVDFGTRPTPSAPKAGGGVASRDGGFAVSGDRSARKAPASTWCDRWRAAGTCALRPTSR